MAHGSFVDWLIHHGMVRAALGVGARRGELLARLIVDPQSHRNPYPLYEQIRRSGPVYQGQALATARHDVAYSVLRDTGFQVGLDQTDQPWFLRATVTRDEARLVFDPIDPPSMLASNPPHHTHYRRMVAQVFTPRAIAALEPRVEAMAQELLDELDGRGSIDLVGDYGALLPITVIMEILGIPIAMREQLLSWGNAATSALDVAMRLHEYRRLHEGLDAMSGWMVDHIRALRAEPGADLLSQLIQVQDADGRRLSDRELLATAGLVLVAGFETTVNLLGTGSQLLLTHPEQRERLAADPDLWSTAVEEVLRWDAPVQYTARVARQETEIGGVAIPAGGLILVLLAGANRDPAVFEDPDRFDVGRHNARDHLAFSAGMHFCLGATLARSQGRIGLRTLFERYPDLTLAGTPVRRPTRNLRGWRELPVRTGVRRDRSGGPPGDARSGAVPA